MGNDLMQKDQNTKRRIANLHIRRFGNFHPGAKWVQTYLPKSTHAQSKNVPIPMGDLYFFIVGGYYRSQGPPL